ncbi:glycerol-3-phosphate acyltransferase [Paenibacillus sp. MMS18-CY102]|uniref:glycerol-3-phosphate acyltransferase n=1 Tax=Paenibacillus sp. MMS18-CY102 TaxID=2682849 RepID=UPI001365B0E9|nr:glycerol-3-phosphate acyltransferase [Paenibacillus sp. MMS18-CY102]MWC28814.1 glycerol-3-phosphate acyltransferase [Paenibacillus sp. MMS18-CY102]
MIVIGWTAVLFLAGSLMFSYWLGLVSRKNLKAVGDGNPGALNLWKAAGYKLGIAGVLLDFAKGYVPLLFIIGIGFGDGYERVPLAIAPIAGHAFSPFLRGKGGKAIAVTFGVWSALTAFEVSLVYAVLLAILSVANRWLGSGRGTSSPRADALQVVGGMLLLGVYLAVRPFDSATRLIWLGNWAILAITHRAELLGWLRKRSVND